MLLFQKKDCLKHLAIGVFLVILGFAIKWIDPLARVIDEHFAIEPEKFLFKLWKDPPIGVMLKFYIFNVTNAEDFLSGKDGRLKVEEIGPYLYKEWLRHDNITFNPNGTISYVPIRYCVPVNDSSGRNPHTDVVFIPNMILLGASAIASKHSTVASYGFKMLADNFKAQPILNMTVNDLLWGYEDPLLSMASKFLPALIHFKKFGIIDRLFDEGRNHITMHLPESIEQIERQQKRDSNKHVASDKIASTSSTASSVLDVEYDEDFTADQEVVNETTPAAINTHRSVNQGNEARRFSVDLWNGLTTLPGFERYKVDNTSLNCNRVQGVFDGTIFPKNVTKLEKFKMYRRAFCRILPIYYSHSGTLFGLDAYWFELSENAFYDRLEDPDTKCFCETTGSCLRKGLGNISPCYYNIPAAVSQPHFYNGDPSLLEEVDGLKPEKEKHQTILAINPQMGMALNAILRIQLNLVNGNLQFYDKVSRFSNTTLPIFWAEFALQKFTFDLEMILKAAFVILPVVQTTIIIILFFVGFILALIAIIPPNPLKASKSFNKKDKLSNPVELPLLITKPYDRDELKR